MGFDVTNSTKTAYWNLGSYTGIANLERKYPDFRGIFPKSTNHLYTAAQSNVIRNKMRRFLKKMGVDIKKVPPVQDINYAEKISDKYPHFSELEAHAVTVAVKLVKMGGRLWIR